ncbi:hypothetical protein J7400_17565 [Shimia sp. R9_2]|uniref:hypothetical protein n=1 Tax=Shimia sp. R9_2 TaxID=2821112 RepID=UPI001ADC7618|nr:hypothetical protein [Shimia sp. R9_2]MBO9398484.1 hypothetical protein [Shimia sp. R9_2]
MAHQDEIRCQSGADALPVTGDDTYAYLTGSQTKRARFKSGCAEFCDGRSIAPLICPIGAGGSRDKRPAEIGATVKADVTTALTSETAAIPQVWGSVPHIAAQ